MYIYTDMQPHGRLGERWERYLHSEAKLHFLELSSITYALLAGRIKYSPKFEDLFIKLLRNDMTWFMNDMIWFNEKG
jgi:hypothetical protein